MADWYAENIEEGVRDVVRLLRDNGFNTTCSCHHDMEVMINPDLDGDFYRLHKLLHDAGHKNYSIQLCLNVMDGYQVNKWISVRLCDRPPAGKDKPNPVVPEGS